MRDVLQNEDALKNIISNLKWAAIVGFIIVLPFALLEITFNTITRQNVAGLTVLFGFLWLLSMAFVGIITPIAEKLLKGNCVAAKPFNLLLRIAFSALVAAMWLGVIVDQFPCFLGIPSCD